MLSRLKESFYWPGCAEAVKNWCKSGLTCATREMTVPKRKAFLQSIQTRYPMQLIEEICNILEIRKTRVPPTGKWHGRKM